MLSFTYPQNTLVCPQCVRLIGEKPMKRPSLLVNRPVRTAPKTRTPNGATPCVNALTFRMRREAQAQTEARNAEVKKRRSSIAIVKQ